MLKPKIQDEAQFNGDIIFEFGNWLGHIVRQVLTLNIWFSSIPDSKAFDLMFYNLFLHVALDFVLPHPILETKTKVGLTL
jgi:hypothetical protein